VTNTNSIQPQPPQAPGHDVLEHQLLSAWVDAAHVGLCVIDDTARIVMLNPGACRKFGVDGTQVLNMPLKALLSGTEGSLNVIQWLSTPGFDGERQVTVHAVDGIKHLLLKTQSLRTPAGERYKVVAITDVTRLTQALLEAEQHRRQWEAVNAGVVISDARLPDMPITYVNPVFERMTGYTSAEVLGHNCRFLQGRDLHQPGITAIKAAIQSQTNGYAILRNFRKDGSLFLNELFISPVKDGQGVVTHFVGIQHLRFGDVAPGKNL
jgi:PAS domain S-box-containing protein